MLYKIRVSILFDIKSHRYGMRVRGVRYNARTEKRNALCAIVKRASRDKVEFQVAHR